MNRVEAKGLSVDFGATRILHDINIDVHGASMVGVIGPNGAGKSTLLRALAGLIPIQGDVQLNARPLSALSLDTLAKQRTFLPQDSTIHWPLSVAATVALGRFPHGDATTLSGQSAIDRAMAAANVTQFRHRPVTELSGGERARVMLARILATEAAIIIADEPAAQLDPRHHWEALRVLRTAAANGAVVILALHDLTAAARMCDQVLVMNAGKVEAFGPPTQILTQELLECVFGVDALIGTTDGAPFIVPLRARG